MSPDTPPSRLTLSRSDGDGKITLVLKGALDVTAGKVHGEAILGTVNQTKLLILDVKDLDYISSAGVRILVQLHKDASKSGCTVRITELSPLVEEVLDISGIRHCFEID